MNSRFSNWVLQISLTVTKLAYLNLLWLLFTLLGLGIFGIMPATVALFTILRKWIKGEIDIQIFKTYWGTYREEFLKSTLLGAILLVIGFVLFFDITHLPSGTFFTFVKIGLYACIVLYFIVLLYFFPLYVHFKMTKKQYLKYALLLGAAYPHITLLMLASLAMALYLIYTFPGSILFFSISFPAYIVMLLAFHVFKKIEKRVEQELEEVSS